MNSPMQFTAGDVYRIGRSGLPAVVVCNLDEPGHGADLRVVPLASGVDIVRLANDHDVLLTPTDYRLGVEVAGVVVARAWLAEPIARAEVGERIGTISAASLQRVRDVELAGLGPVEGNKHAAFRGQNPFDATEGAHVAEASAFLDAWRDTLRAWSGVVAPDLDSAMTQFLLRWAGRDFYKSVGCSFIADDADLPGDAAEATENAEEMLGHFANAA